VSTIKSSGDELMNQRGSESRDPAIGKWQRQVGNQCGWRSA